MSDMKPGDLPAFPGLGYGAATGLTKREYFAAAALQGLCAHSGTYYGPNNGPGSVATRAVECADALLAAQGVQMSGRAFLDWEKSLEAVPANTQLERLAGALRCAA